MIAGQLILMEFTTAIHAQVTIPQEQLSIVQWRNATALVAMTV